MEYKRHEEQNEMSFDGEDSVGEDAELEVSCALHDLALRVKIFEQRMEKTIPRIETEEVEEDYEEIEEEHNEQQHSCTSDEEDKEVSEEEEEEEEEEEVEEHSHKASPKKTTLGLQQKKIQKKYQPQQQEEHEHKKKRTQKEWNYIEKKEELCEIKQHLAQLLKGIKEEAKAFESCEAKNNQ
jgi:hypothetical protein